MELNDFYNEYDNEIVNGINDNIFPITTFDNLESLHSSNKTITVLIIDAGCKDSENNNFNNLLNKKILDELLKLKPNDGFIIGFRYSEYKDIYFIEKILSFNLINFNIINLELINIINQLQPINNLSTYQANTIMSITMEILMMYNWIPSNKNFTIKHVKTYND